MIIRLLGIGGELEVISLMAQSHSVMGFTRRILKVTGLTAYRRKRMRPMAQSPGAMGPAAKDQT